jgi:iron(III) transport system ATP-binding protein
MNFVAATVVDADLVRLGGIELACDADGLAPGTEVTLAIRPEDIVVQAASPASPNAVRMRVEALAFLGSFFRADLVAEATTGALLRADLPVDLVRRLDIAEKRALVCVLPRERIRIYPGSAVHR